MRLGANSVLFGGHSMRTAFKYTALAGYDGIELSAIDGMSQHLVLDRWESLASEIRDLSQEFGLALHAMEQPSRDPARMETAFKAAAAIGIPIVNCGPGGKPDDPDEWAQLVDSLRSLSKMAGDYGVTLCVKAHVGASIYNTPTTLQAMAEIDEPAFGIDMDPSHIHRGGENPVEAIAAVISRVKHVHIRDCLGRQMNPGAPANQANGRGDIDLVGYIRVLHEHGYAGPLDLEVIGSGNLNVAQCAVIAAESRGHMQACLQACGAR
jgi:sugar phosphate isomerase/epimerase